LDFELTGNADATKVGLVQLVKKKMSGDIATIDPNAASKMSKDGHRIDQFNTTGMANSWGFLYEDKDEESIGIMVVMLGKEAIPELVKLLDNETIDLYHGSKEATLGNGY
jgi:hypothetical protein